jgi:hypothetical protein
MSKLKLTNKEVLLAILIGVMGYVFSTREFILFLNSLDPISGFIIYEIIFYSWLIFTSYLGLAFLGVKIKQPLQLFGLWLIWFALFITIDWESPYVQYVTKGNFEGASGVFYQSEDGAVWYFWHDLLNIKNVDMVRILTYVVTPLLLALAGGLLVTRVEFGL